jgi:hypothetical protein
VPGDLLALIRQHKAALLAALANEGVQSTKVKKDASDDTTTDAPASQPTGVEQVAALSPPGHPGWLGDGTAALLERLFAAGCRPDAIPDGETFVADCPRCGRPGALAIRDTAAGVPAVRVDCGCGDAALDGLGIDPATKAAERKPECFPPRARRCEMARRLIGNGYPPIPPTIPDSRIVATPKVICPCCQSGVVLPELRRMTGGRCYECWLRN